MIRPFGPATPRLLAYAASFLAIAFARWIDDMFGEPDIDQILYHLYYAEHAAVEIGEVFLVTLVVEALLVPLGLAVAAAWLHGHLQQRGPAWKHRFLRACPRFALLAGTLALLLQFSVFSYAAAYFAPDLFAENYVAPPALAPPTQPRNLVLIYAESLEETYGHAGLFGRDLLAPLRTLGGHRLGVLRQAPGANWTVAAMVASQCGVPLRVYSAQDIKRQPGERAFLPGATCLGDLLAAHGWHNVFLGGAPLGFAAKGSFLRDHGYSETYGREEWERLGMSRTERNEWGLYDSALFARARTMLAELHTAGRPFNLTLLTIDTHGPHGYASPDCRSRGATDFAALVECSSAEIARFVRFAHERGYLENTVVVIVGDHLAMGNPLSERLGQAESREIFNLVLTDRPLPPAKRELLAFDLFPTLAELVGFQVPRHRLGLGTSVFAPAEVSAKLQWVLPPAALTGSARYRSLWESNASDRRTDPS